MGHVYYYQYNRQSCDYPSITKHCGHDDAKCWFKFIHQMSSFLPPMRSTYMSRAHAHSVEFNRLNINSAGIAQAQAQVHHGILCTLHRTNLYQKQLALIWSVIILFNGDWSRMVDVWVAPLNDEETTTIENLTFYISISISSCHLSRHHHHII